MTFVITMLHKSFDEWLEGRSEESRTLHIEWYNLYRQKENYWNTPKEKRFSFGMKKI